MLQIQIHVVLPPPPLGVEYTSELLDKIAERWLRFEPIPKAAKVRVMEWRTGTGPWKEARTPAALRRAREDFQAISQTGPFEYTTIGVSSMG